MSKRRGISGLFGEQAKPAPPPGLDNKRSMQVLRLARSPRRACFAQDDKLMGVLPRSLPPWRDKGPGPRIVVVDGAEENNHLMVRP